MSAIIDIEPTEITKTGQRYRVWHGDAVLIESTRIPFCDAARELSKAGVTGRIQLRRKGRTQIDATALIAVLATLTVSESEMHGPEIVKYKAFGL